MNVTRPKREKAGTTVLGVSKPKEIEGVFDNA